MKANLFNKLKKIWLILGVFLSMILIGVPLYVALAARPVGGSAQEITVPEGTGRQEIANLLQEKNMIRSPFLFLVATVVSGHTIKAGPYAVDPGQNVFAIADALGQIQNQHLVLTIPEGWRREQIAEALRDKKLDGEGFLKLTTDKEGTLFPDTYFIPRQATAEQVVEKLTKNYDARTSELKPTREQLILASIVERESRHDTDRALIAGIYAHRLAVNMPLEADPTVQYARDTNALSSGKTVKEFWQPITLANYTNVVSPYNTYLNKSYPPGPICNPGLKSLDAAVHPKETDALYFIHTPNGMIVTAKTYEEHRANVRKYLQ